MMTIPNHFKIAFPWILRQQTKLNINSPSTYFIEKEIIRIIFNPPDNELYDPRDDLINSLTHLNDINKETEYIKSSANCLAHSAAVTPLPKEIQCWLNDVEKKAKILSRLISQKPKRKLPLDWNNLTSIVSRIENNEYHSDHSKSKSISHILKKKNSKSHTEIKSSTDHGHSDLVAILNMASNDSKALSNQPAMKYFKYPKIFFKEILSDKTLLLEYQRNSIIAISKINEQYFGKPYDSLTANLLTCIFQKKVSNQLVMKIRNNSAPSTK